MSKRSNKENNALHKGCEIVARELNDKHIYIPEVMREMEKNTEVYWTKDRVKDLLFREFMRAMTGKESTTQLKKGEAGEVYDMMAANISKIFGVDVGGFPSWEQIKLAQNDKAS